MKKMILIILGGVILMLMFGPFGLFQGNSSQLKQEKVELVDERIDALLKDKSYKDADSKEREALVSAMLTELEQDKYITRVSYNEKDGLFSFKYADGSLGGVKIQDLNHKFGDIPMN